MLDGIQWVVKGAALQVYQAPGSQSPPFVPKFSEPILIPVASVDSRQKFMLLEFYPTYQSKPVSMWRDLLFSCVFVPLLRSIFSSCVQFLFMFMYLT